MVDPHWKALVDNQAEIIANQDKVLYNQRWTIGLEWGIIVILIFILIWKVIIYPKMLSLIQANEAVLGVLREFFSSVRWKQDATLLKQEKTLEKVEEVNEKVTTASNSNADLGWKSGDPDRRKGN